jgi:flagellar protein FliL
MAKKKSKSEDGGADEGEGKSKKGGGKLKLIAGVLVLALVAGGGGYWFMGKSKPKTEQMAAGDPKAAQAGAPKKPSAFLDLPEMTINLSASGAGSNDRQQFLRMKVALEVAEQKIATDIQPMLPRVMDTFQVFMRELRAQDLEGSAGLYRLKEEMMRRVNVAVYPAKVDAILFKELMVQ